MSKGIVIPDYHFLTPQKKSAIIRRLNKLIKNKEVDCCMVPYLNQLNKISGVASLTCCRGHMCKKIIKKDKAVFTKRTAYGIIGVALSKKVFNRLFLESPINPLWAGINDVSSCALDFFDSQCRVFFTWESGNTSYHEAMKSIIEYFKTKKTRMKVTRPGKKPKIYLVKY